MSDAELPVFAEVSWNAIDIRTLRPDWSDEACHDLLGQIEDQLQQRMIERGWFYLNDVMRSYALPAGVVERAVTNNHKEVTNDND